MSRRRQSQDEDNAGREARGGSESEAQAGPPDDRLRLPEERGDRESRMWQTLQAGQTVESGKLAKKGMMGFGCPVCGQPVWIRRRDAGDAVRCEACGSTVRLWLGDEGGEDQRVEIVERAAGFDAGERERAVLPERRRAYESIRTGRARRPDSEDEEESDGTDDAGPAEETGLAKAPAVAGSTPPEGGSARERRARQASEESASGVANRPTRGAKNAGSREADRRASVETAESFEQSAAAAAQQRKADRFQPEKAPRLDALTELAEESMAERPEWWNLIDKENEEATETVRRWTGPQLVLFGLLLIGVTFGVLFFLASVAPPAAEVADEQREAQAEVEEILALGRELLDRTRRFLDAPTLDERVSLVREPERARPRLQRFYGETEPIRDSLGVVSASSLLVDRFEQEGRNFAGVLLDFTDGSRRGVIFEDTPDGWKLDWESFAGFSDVSLDEFAESPAGTTASIRILYQSDDYFNYGYRDPEKLACFLLEDPDRLQTMWAYCERDGEVHRELEEAAERNSARGLDRAEAILRLRIEDKGAGTRQAWIEAVEAIGHLEI